MPVDTTSGLPRFEVEARREEGCDVPAGLLERIGLLDRDAVSDPEAEALYDELMALPDDAELAAAEPNELDAIRALRPDGPRDLGWSPDDDEALDRFHGAWTGRAVGCALGKPVEGVGMSLGAGGGATGRRRIRAHLEARDEWPLRDYFAGNGDGDGLICPASQRAQIAHMEPDDDIHYTLVALACLEEHGPAFTWEHVAQLWSARLPAYSLFTAEAQALETFHAHTTRPYLWRTEATPALTRRHRNPFRQWIGAQIRSDGWAWACAGNPELAAELAHRDASWTHERNGIYGAMMFAAIQAAAFVEHDPARLVEIGLSEIPRDCRLARFTRDLLTWIRVAPDFEACAARIEEATPGMSPVHTINNALICILALFAGAMRPDDVVTTAVMCGHDTDCNGATSGSIAGAATGRAAFGGTLADRLNDTIKPAIVGFESISMRELAERTLVQHRRVAAYARDRAVRSP